MPRFIVNYRRFQPIAEGLRDCGYEVVEDTWDPTDAELTDCDGYLVCMYNAMKRPLVMRRLKAQLRERHIPLIGWNRDAPWNKGARTWRLWWLRRFHVLDLYGAHSMQGAETFTREHFYLPNAAWVSQYNLAGHTFQELRDPSFYLYDVSFVGNLDTVKYPEFSHRDGFFHALEQRLAPLGIRVAFRQGHGMPVAEQVEIIQRSRININFGAACDDGPEKSWGLPERCYGIPACGGFLLSDERRHAKDDFVSEREWVSFSNLDECVTRICHFLAHFDQARVIAEQAHSRVLRDHTYRHRAARLVEFACRWRERGRC